jgi:hypothetical protein
VVTIVTTAVTTWLIVTVTTTPLNNSSSRNEQMPVTKEAMDTALELVSKGNADWCLHSTSYSYCAGTYIDKDGTENGEGRMQGAACHGFVQFYEPNKYSLFYNCNCAAHRSGDEKTNEAFMRWLLEASPFKKWFVNPTYESFAEGGAFIDVDCGNTLLLFLCKTMRMINEENYRIVNWKKLVDLGVHPVLALCVASICTTNLNAGSGRTHSSCMSPPTNERHLEALFRKEVGPVNLGWETSEVYGGAKYWYDTVGCLLPIPTKTGQQIKVPDGWGGYIMKTNPASVEELAKQLIKIQKEYV